MMRTGALMPIAAAAILVAGSPSPKAEAPAPVVDTSAIVATIQAGEAGWGKAYEARDAEAVGAHYAPDAVFMPLDAPPFRGREALIAAMKKAPADKDYTMVFIPEKVDVAASGDLAVSIGSFEQHRSLPATVVKTGTYLASYRKQPDGAWLVTALSSTLDAPLGKGVSRMAAPGETSSAGQPGVPIVSSPFALTADHPNAVWLAEIYRGGAAIQNDPTLDKETRERKMADHLKKIFARISPKLVIHTGGIRLAATGDEAFMKAYSERRNALSKGTFRAVEVDQILANDSFGVVHGTFAAERDGKTFTFVGMGAWRFENGLAVEHWEIPPGEAWDNYFIAADPNFKGRAEAFWLKK